VLTPPVKPPGPARAQWPEPGQSGPNLRFGNTQLSDQRGKPVVLIFFKAGGETTELSLAIADALEKRYGGNAVVVPLVAFGETDAAINDRNRLKYGVQVYDGKTAATAYGVATVPRFAVIDGDGKVKWTFTGVGSETGYLVKEQLDRLARPILPDGPPGKIVAPGPATTPIVPRP
jgi:peroxiredoxin